MIITTVQELHELTGSYDLSNKFGPIISDIEQQTEVLITHIGRATYEYALKIYDTPADGRAAADAELLKLVQRPIAILATLRYFQGNIVSHSDEGRISNIDPDVGKVSYEWQLRRDDEAKERKAFYAIDLLIRFLIENEIAPYIDSAQYKKLNALMVNNLGDFQQHFNIDDSYRFFFIIVPVMENIQNRVIKPVLGDLFTEISLGENDLDLYRLSLCRNIIVTRAVAQALGRFSPSLFPEGLLTQIVADKGRVSLPDPEKSELLKNSLLKEATESLDLLNRTFAVEGEDIFVMPNNSASNKFFRT